MNIKREQLISRIDLTKSWVVFYRKNKEKHLELQHFKELLSLFEQLNELDRQEIAEKKSSFPFFA